MTSVRYLTDKEKNNFPLDNYVDLAMIGADGVEYYAESDETGGGDHQFVNNQDGEHVPVGQYNDDSTKYFVEPSWNFTDWFAICYLNSVGTKEMYCEAPSKTAAAHIAKLLTESEAQHDH